MEISDDLVVSFHRRGIGALIPGRRAGAAGTWARRAGLRRLPTEPRYASDGPSERLQVLDQIGLLLRGGSPASRAGPTSDGELPSGRNSEDIHFDGP
jgi:hypothetical protein